MVNGERFFGAIVNSNLSIVVLVTTIAHGYDIRSYIGMERGIKVRRSIVKLSFLPEDIKSLWAAAARDDGAFVNTSENVVEHILLGVRQIPLPIAAGRG